MEEVSIVGLDLAKNVFQAHGARGDGSTAFRKKISRAKVLAFVASAPKCVVAMEACASSHHWARQIGALGHEVRLIAPIYVKSFVKRNKNDAADAEAIGEARRKLCGKFLHLAHPSALSPSLRWYRVCRSSPVRPSAPFSTRS
jgi:transposase